MKNAFTVGVEDFPWSWFRLYSHRHPRIFEMTRQELREDTRKAEGMPRDISAEPILTYRGPNSSIMQDLLWAFAALTELGFTHDSTLFPLVHSNYGMPQATRARFRDALGLRSLELELRSLLQYFTCCPLGLLIEENANSNQHRRVRHASAAAQ